MRIKNLEAGQYCAGACSTTPTHTIQLIVMLTVKDNKLPVLMKIPEYTKIKQWHSDQFYIHEKGYKMCLHIFPGGYNEGRGTHMSVSLFLMKGPNDDELIGQ